MLFEDASKPVLNQCRPQCYPIDALGDGAFYVVCVYLLWTFQIFDMLLNGDLYPYKPYFYNQTLSNNYYNYLLTEVLHS